MPAGFEQMISDSHYWYRARGNVRDFKFYQRAFNELGFVFIPAMNAYKRVMDGYATQEMLWRDILIRVEQLKAVHEKSHEEQPLPDLSMYIPLKREMFPYQGNGAAYMIHKCRSFNCDQQGLGKSIQSLAAAIGLGCSKILIVCKLSLCMNWEREVKEWTHLVPMIFRDSIHRSWPMYFDTGSVNVGIVNYDSLEKYFVQRITVPPGDTFTSNHIELVKKFDLFDCIIIDESHYGKDPTTKRTKMLIRMCRSKKNVFLLSGTPILNDAYDIYPQLCMLNLEHRFAASPAAFQAMYGGKKNKNLPLLHALLKRHGFVRRLKKDVLKDLPEKTRQNITIPLDNQQEYDFAENEFLKFLQETMKKTAGEVNKALRAQALTQMNHLRRIAARGKLYAVIEWALDLRRDGQKVVLFGHHKDVLSNIKSHLPGAVTIVGSDDMETRESNKRKFIETKEVNEIICSINAAAEGHTLVVASNLGVVEFPWHFGKLEQMEDRIHRIGQKDGALITNFIAKGTIDEHMYHIIMKKKDIHDQVTGTDEEVSTDVVDDLINMLLKKRENGQPIESAAKVEAEIIHRDPPRLEID